MKLLPLAAEPFTPPNDRDMLPSERREFVRTHRTCVFGYGRQKYGPAMSIEHYIPTDSDELLVSTTREHPKARAVGRNGKISLCVLDERSPLAYLQVYCDARVDDDSELVTDVMMAVGDRTSWDSLPEQARPVVAEIAKREDRVVIRCRPYETFGKLPRHLHRNDQEAQLPHWISGAVPWDASDDGPA